MTNPDLTLFITRPISLLFMSMAVISLMYPLYLNYRAKRAKRRMPAA
jgi:TctA family transporter